MANGRAYMTVGGGNHVGGSPPTSVFRK